MHKQIHAKTNAMTVDFNIDFIFISSTSQKICNINSVYERHYGKMPCNFR